MSLILKYQVDFVPLLRLSDLDEENMQHIFELYMRSLTIDEVLADATQQIEYVLGLWRLKTAKKYGIFDAWLLSQSQFAQKWEIKVFKMEFDDWFHAPDFAYVLDDPNGDYEWANGTHMPYSHLGSIPLPMALDEHAVQLLLLPLQWIPLGEINEDNPMMQLD